MVKLGKRSRRMEKWENQWYQRWGLSAKCSICGADHPAMNKKFKDDRVVGYDYNCPIAAHNQWPPTGFGKQGINMWRSLEASPSKLASFHGYNHEEVARALDQWEHYGSGILASPEDCLSFRLEVHLVCDTERQGWTFKRTLVTVVDYDANEKQCQGIKSEEGS